MTESNKIKFILWLGRFVHDSASDKPSVKRFGLAITVTVLCIVLFSIGVAIVAAILMSEGREQVEIIEIAGNVFIWTAASLLSTVGGAYVLDKNLGRKKPNDTAN